MLKNVSLLHLFPMLLLGSGLLFVIFFYSVTFPAANEQALALSRQHTRSVLQAQQGRIAELLVIDDTLALVKEIYYLSTDPGTYRILVMDEKNTIRYANRSRIIGKHVSESQLPIQVEKLSRLYVDRTIFMDTVLGNDRHLVGYAPLFYVKDGIEYEWRLVIIRDYKRLADSVIAIATYPSELLATFLLVSSILTIVILRQHIHARISPIIKATAAVARGEKNVRTHLTGLDEFADIGQSFDQMASRIDANKIELENARENAETANSAKNHFLSHMSHEIQTPLTAIMGFLDLLKDTKLDSDASLYLLTMETSASTLSHLVNDLLEINRLEAGSITLRPQPFCLNTVVQETIDSQLPRAQAKGLSIKVTTNESDPIWLDSDARTFRQILLNLLGNAVLYTEEGNINIIIEIIPYTSAEANVQISVVDTGIGISDHDMPHIFERFYRSDHPHVRSQKGAGLGLSICRDFADLLHAEISVETQRGVGTSFIFRGKVQLAEPEENFDFADLSLREQESQNIMLVEHEPVTQVLFQSILEKSGHHVDIFGNAKSAIQFAKDRLIYPHLPPISLIIMDLNLPQKDGFQVAKEIRGLDTRFANTPIVATSTQDDQTTRNRCLDGIFDGFIAKPINRQYLIEEIFRLTKLSETSEQKEASN